MKKKLISLCTTLLFFAAYIGLFYLFLRANADMNEQLNLKYGADMNSALCFLCIPVGLLISYMLLRAGSLFFGLISGYRLNECSILGLGLHRNADGRLRFTVRRPIKRLCALLVPPSYDGSSPYRLMVMGGMITCAVLGAIMIALPLLIRSVPELLYAGVIGATLFIIATLFTFRSGKGLLSYLRRLGSNVHLRRAREHHLYVQALQRQGLSLSDLPKDFFAPYPKELWTDPTVFIAQHNICSNLLAPGSYSQAHALFTELAALLDQPDMQMPHKEITRLYLTCSGAIAETMCGAPPNLSEKLNEPNIELFLGGGSWGLQLLIAKYLRELLVTHDPAAARRLLNAIDNYPRPLTAGQRATLQEAQAMASDHNTQEVPHE